MKYRSKPVIRHVRISRALTRSGLPDLDYALNPYIGCLHGCIYCYARLYTRYKIVRENWGSIVFVKDNLIDVLRKDIVNYPPGVVGVGTITDPYQPVEAVYELTRKSIEILLVNGFHTSIQTKNSLILRDLDLLVKYKDNVDVGFTITSLDPIKSQRMEPWASPPIARVNALKKISEAGVETWIFLGPIIPGYNDDSSSIESIIKVASETGSKVLIDKLHVKKFIYEKNHPLHGLIRIVKNYDWRGLFERISSICREYNVECIQGLAEPIKHKSVNRKLDEFINL